MIVESLSVAGQLHESNSRAMKIRNTGKPTGLPVLPRATGTRAWHLLSPGFGKRRPFVAFCRQLMCQLCHAIEFNELCMSFLDDNPRRGLAQMGQGDDVGIAT
jgi:hypothetical protein